MAESFPGRSFENFGQPRKIDHFFRNVGIMANSLTCNQAHFSLDRREKVRLDNPVHLSRVFFFLCHAINYLHVAIQERRRKRNVEL